MSRWIIAVLAAGVVVLVGVMAQGFGKDPHAVPFKLRGREAPGFELKRVDADGTLGLSNLRGKPVVLNFWATWCGPCEAEHPVLAWGAKRYAPDVQFIGVVFEDTEDNVRRYLAEHGAGFPQLFDPRSRVAVDYGASGVPETYFIDADGRIVDKHLGAIDSEALARNVERLRRGGEAQTQ